MSAGTTHAATDGGRVGCIGFCMGGQLALSAGARNDRIAAVVDCYGVHPNVEVDFSNMRAALLGVFAENDDFVPPERARQLEADVRSAGGRAHCNVYVGVSHAFLNETRPDVYDAATAADAWNDILPFLHTELG